MKQQTFEEQRQASWTEFERQVVRLEKLRPGQQRTARGRRDSSAFEDAEFPQRYREICRDLAVAIARCYSPSLVDRLNRLAVLGHQQLYVRTTAFWRSLVEFIAVGFPNRVRADGRAVAIAAALFCVPGLALFVAVLISPEMIYSIMSPDQVAGFEAMYDPAVHRIGSDRSADSDFQMFGFYIWNNIAIGFRMFASGIAAGIGTVVFLVLNSLILGGLSAHIVHVGFEETFFPFVIGHGAFELTGFVIAGAAGLKLGSALIAPGRWSRVDALRIRAGESIQLIYGVICMLAIAALLEAFWSSKSTLPPEWKLGAGFVLWLLVLGYFALAGRRRGA